MIIGAGVTLTDICESGQFPALGAAGARIADHSVQGKITLGGNLAGTIIYREAALPLMLADAIATVAGPKGQNETPFCKAFKEGRLCLKTGEFLLSVAVPRKIVQAPWFHTKRTKMEEIGYPLLTLVALKARGQIRLAVSGMYPHPVRLEALERELSRPGSPQEDRALSALGRLPPGIMSNLDGSADYRQFIFGTVLDDCLSKLEAG